MRQWVRNARKKSRWLFFSGERAVALVCWKGRKALVLPRAVRETLASAVRVLFLTSADAKSHNKRAEAFAPAL